MLIKVYQHSFSSTFESKNQGTLGRKLTYTLRIFIFMILLFHIIFEGLLSFKIEIILILILNTFELIFYMVLFPSYISRHLFDLKCINIFKMREHFLHVLRKNNELLSVAQSCLILCNPIDCSPTGSSVHGI